MNPESENLVAERLVPENSTLTEKSKRNQIIGAVIIGVAAIAIVMAWTMNPETEEVAKLIPATKVEPETTAKPTAIVALPEETVIEAVEKNVVEEKPVAAIVEEVLLKAPPPKSLRRSDIQVLIAVADFAPDLAKWLLPKDQLRKWVMTIDLMADGKLPRRYRPVDFPVGKFEIKQSNNINQMSSANFQRMQPIIDVITATDPKTLSQYYKQWLPLLETAYKELGKKDTFDERFRLAIKNTLASDPLEKTPNLVRPSVFYQFEEKTLEKSSDIEKILWRMGSDNSESIQFFLRELRFYMDEQ